MSELIEKITEILIETIVLSPILLVAICVFLFALIVYPLKKIRKWLAIQGIRMLDMWAYYTENRDVYFDRS